MIVESYHSIISNNFLQPIASAVHSLVRVPRESVDWKTNEGDLDWILSGTLLTVAMLECALRWTHLHRVPSSRNEGLYLYEELRAAYAQLPNVLDAFVLRNAIAHGHVWELSIPKSGVGRAFAKITRLRRDDFWKRSFNPHTNLTNSGLHVIPTLMTRRDLKRVREMVTLAFESLVALDLLPPDSLTSHVIWPDGSGTRIVLAELSTRI